MDDRANTIAGWVLFAGIVALGGTIVAGEYFKAERPEKMCYPIEGVQEESTGGGEAAEQPAPFYLASAKPELGSEVFKKCTACHNAQKGGPNGTGPNLWGVVGSPIAGRPDGFDYSSALKGKGGTWDFDALNKFIANPKGAVPGTAMGFAGIPKDSERADVIAYLNSLSDSPKPLPTAAK